MMKRLPSMCCGIFLMGLSGCGLLPLNPAKDPDFHTEGTQFRFNFKVGDRFETLKPMFLIDPHGDPFLVIERPGSGAPDLEDYRINNEVARGYKVVRFLPKGTKIRVAGIKKYSGPAVYLCLDDDPTWVQGYFHVMDVGGGLVYWNYNTEWYRKLK